MIRDGYVARWQGDEYEASPDGNDVRLYRDGILEITFTIGPAKEPGRHITIEVPKEPRTVKPK